MTGRLNGFTDDAAPPDEATDLIVDLLMDLLGDGCSWDSRVGTTDARAAPTDFSHQDS